MAEIAYPLIAFICMLGAGYMGVLRERESERRRRLIDELKKGRKEEVNAK